MRAFIKHVHNLAASCIVIMHAAGYNASVNTHITSKLRFSSPEYIQSSLVTYPTPP